MDELVNLPGAKSGQRVVHPDDDEIEEERRLMYVAITRARKRLYLSYAGSRMLHGQPRYGIVSRFIEEIPPPLCKWIVLPEKQFENRGQGAWARGSYGGEVLAEQIERARRHEVAPAQLRGAAQRRRRGSSHRC